MKKFSLLFLALIFFYLFSCSYISDGAAVSVVVKNEESDSTVTDEQPVITDADSKAEGNEENSDEKENLVTDPETKKESDEKAAAEDESVINNESVEDGGSLSDDESEEEKEESGTGEETESGGETESGEGIENEENIQNTDEDAAQVEQNPDKENENENSIEEKSDTDTEAAQEPEPVLQPTEIPEDEQKMSDIENENQIIQKERKWSILLYMCGDNNLESAAIRDLLEIEYSKIDTDVVSVFALVDRSSGYNTSNQNWSGTRLYRLKTGGSKDSSDLISERIECKNLGLQTDLETELDMSSSYVLSGAMSYVIEKFPADHYGLIVWGHGTGWRGESDIQLPEEGQTSVWKGFAYDETSGTYMTLNQFGNGLKNCLGNKKLDFIGFDTCYGGEIEIMYEIKDYARYGIGTEGLVASDGWNYEGLFNQLSEDESLTPESFCDAVVKQFKSSYSSYNRSSIAVVNLEAVNDYVLAFNNYCAAVADKINDIDTHESIMGVLYDNENCLTEKYTYGKAGYDIYLDVNSIVENLQKYFVAVKKSSDLINLYSIFRNTATSLYYSTWASDRATGGLGVYFSTLTQGCYLSTTHPSAYVSGKTFNQIKFVADCTGYVPAASNGKGLLDKLFYISF